MIKVKNELNASLSLSVSGSRGEFSFPLCPDNNIPSIILRSCFFIILFLVVFSFAQVKFKLKINKNKAGTKVADDGDVRRELKKQVSCERGRCTAYGNYGEIFKPISRTFIYELL